MKIIQANIYVLRIPFHFSFGHFLKDRNYSDSIVVELQSDTGVCGYGEGLARPYVTGETAEQSILHIQNILLPAILNKSLQSVDTGIASYKAFAGVDAILPDTASPEVIAWNASRSAVELALIDCLLRGRHESLSAVLPPYANEVTYTGIISSGNEKDTAALAEKARQAELRFIKMKIDRGRDYERIKIVRDIMGPSVSIRLDANGAFSARQALQFIASVEKLGIDSIEQPVKRGDIAELAAVKAGSSIPVMVDESLVNSEDAKLLIEHKACDYFNLRISKCGGIYRTLALAELAERNGIKCQLGCLVGETAILSAVGRHVAACLPNMRFVEGSYGDLLLQEDIAQQSIGFGKGGTAPVLTGNGLGVDVNRSILEKYSKEIICVSPDRPKGMAKLRL
jgi:muconate cycloisomerase